MYVDTILKLVIAVILGGIVGFEREFKSRPAGLRTHILVCVGAALVQIVSINFYHSNPEFLTDPMRLGAQVISGIGFLGAGTIIKEGMSIKGLTTAATIWAVGCIGLAVGVGLYLEAAAATGIIFISLRGFKKVEDWMSTGKRYVDISIVADNVPGELGQIGSAFGAMGISIINVRFIDNEKNLIQINFTLKIPSGIENNRITGEIMSLRGIKEIDFI